MLYPLLAAAGLALLAVPDAMGWIPAHALASRLIGATWLATSVCFAAYVWSAEKLRAYRYRWTALLVLFAMGAFPFVEPGRADALAKLLALAGFLLLAAGLIGWRALHPFFAKLAAPLHAAARLPRWLFLWLLYTTFLCLTVFLSWYCFQFLPTLIDTISQYVHSKFMASGHFYLESHTYREFFDAGLMINDGKWYSQYQPLHIMLLALGQLAGVPWLVNPLLGALTLIATYALARRITDEATARLAAALMLISPFILMMSSEYMNHATSLLFTTLMALCYVATLQAFEEKNKRCYSWSFGAGLCMGAVFLTRPLTALGVGLPLILHALYLTCRRPRLYFLLFLPAAVAGALCLLFQGWYNLQTTGDIWLFPYAAHHITNVPGFNHGHTLWEGIVMAHRTWLNINRGLFESVLPDTLFAFAACLLPLGNRYLRLLVGIVVSATLVNIVNRYYSSLFGARYLYEIASVLMILSALGLRRLPDLLATWRIKLPERNVLQGITLLLVACAWTAGWSWILPRDFRGYSHHYLNGNPDFYYSMLRQATPPALVFIELIDHPPAGSYKIGKYLYVAHTNPPEDNAPVIFAIDRGERNKKLMDYYPARNVYIEHRGKLRLIRKFWP